MKNYIVWDVLTRDWWDGNEFSSKPPLVVDASTLAALRQTYKGRKTLLETEVVTLPTITEEEFEEQEKASVLFANAMRIDKAYTQRLGAAIDHAEQKAEKY